MTTRDPVPPSFPRSLWDTKLEQANFEYHCVQVLEGLLLRRAVVENAIERIEAIIPFVHST